jgi:hypothetical protein
MKVLTTKIIPALILLAAYAAHANSGSQVFEMKYEVIQGTAVCWQTCRHSRCEESDYEVFFDSKIYTKLSSLKAEGKAWRANNLECGDDITIVDEQMPLLQKQDPKAVSKILVDKGSEVELLIYTDVRAQAADFINQLLKDLGN